GFSLVVTLALSLAGTALAWRLWGRPSPLPERLRRRYPWAARTLEERFYFDRAYDLAFYEPSARAAGVGTRYVEQPVFLTSLGELALWIGTALNFDFGDQGLQLSQQQTWFSDLGVSYHVGLFDFSLWLVGLTAIVSAAAIGYGFWSQRERPAVYLGLILFLEG